MVTAPDVDAREAARRHANMRGILAMLIASACFVAGDGIVKVVGREVPLGQMVVVRGIMATVLMVAVVMATQSLRAGVPLLSRPIVLRTLGDIGATLSFFAGLVHLPFSVSAAVGQFTPLVVTAGAAIFLREAVGWRRWLATAVGLVGVVMIIQPGTSAFDWATLYIVAAVLFVAIRDVSTRTVDPRVPTLLLSAISTAAVAASGLALGVFETWIWPTPGALLYLLLAAITVSGGFTAMIIAIRAGEISVIGPFRYSSILYALAISVVVFGESLDTPMILGVLLVVLAGLYTFHREGIRRSAPAGAS